MDRQLARVLADLTTGIYVLTVADHEVSHGMSSSWVTQVSGTPLLIMASVDERHLSRQVIARTGAFGLNLIGHKSRALEDYFFSAQARRPNNLEGWEYDLSPTLHVPWLRAAMASLEARVIDSKTAGDHCLLVAEPMRVRINSSDRALTSQDLDYVYLGGKEVFARERPG